MSGLVSSGPQGGGPSGDQVSSQATAARPAAVPAGTDLDDLAERVYRLLQEDLRLGRLRRDGER